MEGDDRVDHRQFWNLVRSRWIVLTVFALIGLIAGSAYVIVTPREYTSEAELFVAAAGVDNTADLAQGGNFSQQQARNYSAIATKEIVLAPAISSLDLSVSPKALARQLSVTVPLNTSVVSIVATDANPRSAARIANAVASSLVDTVVKIVPKKSNGTTPVRLEVVQSATVPKSPSAPNTRISILLGLIAGLVVGLILIVLREIASTRIRSSDQILELGAGPFLGAVLNDRRAAGKPLLDPAHLGSVRGEEFRQLRTALYASEAQSHSVIVVSSSVPREGKSVTAANLAITIAATGRSVCLVDADLRTPELDNLFSLPADTPGLSEVLAGEISVDAALQPWDDTSLSILAAGRVDTGPTELLGSAAATRTIARLRERFDYVIIDSPALLPVADGSILAGIADGALLVVGAGLVEKRELERSLDTLGASGAAVTGIIFNRAPARALGRYRRAYVHADSHTQHAANGGNGRTPRADERTAVDAIIEPPVTDSAPSDTNDVTTPRS